MGQNAPLSPKIQTISIKRRKNMNNSAELSDIDFSKLLKTDLSDFSAEDIAKMIKLGDLALEERHKRKVRERAEYNNQIAELLRNCNEKSLLSINDITRNRILYLDKIEIDKEGYLIINLR